MAAGLGQPINEAAAPSSESMKEQQLPAELEKKKEMDDGNDQTPTYTRRAAAGVLARLRQNKARLAQLPPSMVQACQSEDPDVKSNLITMITEAAGDMGQVMSHFSVSVMKQGQRCEKDVLEPMTEAQVRMVYGASADRLMAEKRSQGLVEVDPNLSEGMLFLVSKRTRHHGWMKESVSLCCFKDIAVACHCFLIPLREASKSDIESPPAASIL